MARCEIYEEELWETAESGHISPRLAGHLAECAHCREALQALKAAVPELHALREIDTPELHLALPARRVWRVPAYAYAVAAVLVLLAGMLRLLLQQKPAQQIVHQHTPPTPQLAPRRNAPKMAFVPKIATGPSIKSKRHYSTRIRRLPIIEQPMPPAEETPTPPELVSIFGAPEAYSAEEIAQALPVSTDQITPLSALPLTYTIVCLGTTPPPPTGEVIPIFDAQQRASINHIEEDDHALPSTALRRHCAAAAIKLAGAGAGATGNRRGICDGCPGAAEQPGCPPGLPG